jgi:hypothetical protein
MSLKPPRPQYESTRTFLILGFVNNLVKAMALIPTLVVSILATGTPVAQDFEWLPYRDEQRAVSVEFPGWQPLQPHPGPILKGAFVRNGNALCVFVYCELPKGTDPKAFLPKAYDDHVARVKWARSVSRNFGEWQGLPVYEGEFRIGSLEREITARVRLVVLGNRLFQQYAQWRTTDRDRKPVADRFFDSLKLIR